MPGKIIIDIERCKGCAYCTKTCPRGQIQLSDSINKLGQHFAIFSDDGKCTGCTLCAEICPFVCIEVYRDEKSND